MKSPSDLTGAFGGKVSRAGEEIKRSLDAGGMLFCGEALARVADRVLSYDRSRAFVAC
jgi:hypothetical protein